MYWASCASLMMILCALVAQAERDHLGPEGASADPQRQPGEAFVDGEVNRRGGFDRGHGSTTSFERMPQAMTSTVRPVSFASSEIGTVRV
jgi:hypothetical protein